MKSRFLSSIFSLSMFAVVSMATSFAYATENTLGTYNLILIEDYNFSGGDVEGRAFIGGDLNASGVAEFGSRLSNLDTAVDAVTIAGTTNAGLVRILNGNNVVYNNLPVGETASSTFEVNGSGTVRQDSDLSIDALESELRAQAAYFESLSATDGATFNNGNFAYSGSESSVVFDISADELFSTNINANIDFNSLDSVIINVNADVDGDGIGDAINVDGGVNLNGFGNAIDTNTGTTNVVWNFYNATSINFNNLAVRGAVLAPYADLTGGASFDGAVAALSYTGAREFHNFVFNFDTPDDVNPPQEVPAPNVFILILAGLVYISRKRNLV